MSGFSFSFACTAGSSVVFFACGAPAQAEFSFLGLRKHSSMCRPPFDFVLHPYQSVPARCLHVLTLLTRSGVSIVPLSISILSAGQRAPLIFHTHES
jgi:hypothetical protein